MADVVMGKRRVTVSATDLRSGSDKVYEALQVDSYGRLLLASHDAVTVSDRVAETDPVSQHFVSETLLDLTNIAQGTTDYAYFDMDGYRHFGLTIVASGVPVDTITVTVEATCQDDGTAPASCTYGDVTNQLFGVASWVDVSASALTQQPVLCKYVRVKYVTNAGGGNDQDLTVYCKRGF